ncbi:hypothetical protein IAE29_10165 [Ochrobactrum sp. S46]|nr:hypothetical protein [Ochrobactrum sp. S45]MBK0043696.1 hypothetical protein [Ochrobactrum sp. S46]
MTIFAFPNQAAKMHPIIFEFSFQSAIALFNSGRIVQVVEAVQHFKKDELDTLQLSRLSEFEKVLAPLTAIEEEFGMGSCLNLKRIQTMQALNAIMHEDDAIYLPEHFQNAERYREISGVKWIWENYDNPEHEEYEGYENPNPYIDQTSAMIEKRFGINPRLNVKLSLNSDSDDHQEDVAIEFRMKPDRLEIQQYQIH